MVENKKAEGSRRKNGRLAVKLTVILGVSIIAINLLQNVILDSSIKNRMLEDSIDRYTELSLNYAKTINQTIDEYLAKLEYYNKQDVLFSENNNEIASWLLDHGSERPAEFMYVAWVDLDGNMYTDLGDQAQVTDREYYNEIIKKGKDVFVNNPVISKTTHARVVHVAKSVKRNGKLYGAIVGVINIDIPGIFLGKIDVNPLVCCTLFSGDGQFMGMAGEAELMGLDKADASEVEKVNIAINNDIRQGKNGHLWVAIPGAPTTGMFYAPIKYTTWSVSLTLDQSTILSISLFVKNLMLFFTIIMTLVVIGGIIISLSVSLKPLRILESSISEIATGNADLTKRIDIKANNEIGRVVDSFNSFSEKLQAIMTAMKDSKDELVGAGAELNKNTTETEASINSIISNIDKLGTNISSQNDIVNETADAVNEISANIDSLNNLINTQGAAVTQASAAVEQMIGNISSVSNSVRKMSEEFTELQARVGNGIDKQEAVNDKIKVIELESKTLQEANAVIANIASQTNLLAMNAAIEAAHAGEAGKGFSVVADEIRKLSENSSNQSNSIGNQLKKIQDSIDEIVSVSQEAQSAFSLVSNEITDTSNLVNEISISMEEQAEGSKQISVALANMNETSSLVQNSSKEMSEGNKTIINEIRSLQEAAYNMKSSMDEMSNGVRMINDTGSALAIISERMEDSIAHIGGQVDQFQV